MILIGVFGAGGHGRSIMPIVRQSAGRLLGSKFNECELVFVVEDGHSLESVNAHKVMTEAQFFTMDAEMKYFNVSIANSRVREILCERALKNRCEPIPVIPENAVIFDNNEIGEGVMLSPFVTITSNIKIGKYFHANLYSYVEHDCCIGDYVTFAPNVHCNGRVEIGDHVYIGSGAVIRNGSVDRPLKIGERAVIGMGAVVTKNVAAGTTVVGNPARPI